MHTWQDQLRIVGYFRLWVQIGSTASGQSGEEQDGAGVFALPGLLPIYGLAINGPTRGQRHLSITNGTFALTVNALEAIWFNC